MKCKQCGAELVPGAKFCMECGAEIPQVSLCQNCGAELLLRAKFCMECGTPVGQKSGGIQMGDANAISAQNVVGGDLEILNGNKEIVQGNKITADSYTVNNITNESGFAQSTINVEDLLKKGKEYYEDGNYFRALNIFREIEDQDMEAVYYIALCTREGNGTKQDYKKALALFEKAAMSGLPDAQTSLGLMYLDPDYEMVDMNKAVAWLEKAAEQGDSCALENLGEMYLCGYHVQKDEKKAFSLLKRAENHPFSQLTEKALANIYFNGNVVERNISKAYYYYHSHEGKNWSADFPFDNEVVCESSINYATILLYNLDNHGDTDFGKLNLQYAIDHFNSDKAREMLETYDAEYVYYRGVGASTPPYARDKYGVKYADKFTSIWGVNNLKDMPKEYKILDTVIKIDNYAFCGCKQFRSIIIPDSVTEIGENAFQDCTNLILVRLSKSITKIGNDTFNGCKSLGSIVVPDSVSEIGTNAFQSCSRLTSVRLSKSLTQIKESTFEGCTSIKNIIIPDSVTHIGPYVFYKCSQLTSVTLGKSVRQIEKNAFIGCSSLKVINLPKRLKNNPVIVELQNQYNLSLHEID